MTFLEAFAVHLFPALVANFLCSMIWLTYVRSERNRLRAAAARMGVQIADETQAKGPPLCVVCGADAPDPILWCYGPGPKGQEDHDEEDQGAVLSGDVPHLMRSLNLCEECGYRVAQEIA